jgi:hypothetical protein
MNYREQGVYEYLERLGGALSRESVASRTCERLFDDFLAIVEAPSPEDRMRPCFANPGVLRRLARTLHIPHSGEVRDAIDRVAPFSRRERLATSYRVRELSPLGLYPNLEVASGPASYAICKRRLKTRPPAPLQN